jgi:hypothetical protein
MYHIQYTREDEKVILFVVVGNRRINNNTGGRGWGLQ